MSGTSTPMPVEPLADMRHGGGGLVAVDGDAHEFRAGAGKRRDLAGGCPRYRRCRYWSSTARRPARRRRPDAADLDRDRAPARRTPMAQDTSDLLCPRQGKLPRPYDDLGQQPAVNAPAAPLIAVSRSGVRSSVSPWRASNNPDSYHHTSNQCRPRPGQAEDERHEEVDEEMFDVPMQPGADLHVRRDQRSDHGGDEDNRAAKRDLFRAGTGHSPNIPWTSSWPGLSRPSTSLLSCP